MTNIIPLKPEKSDHSKIMIMSQLYGISLQLNTIAQYLLNTENPDLSDIVFHACKKIETVGDSFGRELK